MVSVNSLCSGTRVPAAAWQRMLANNEGGSNNDRWRSRVALTRTSISEDGIRGFAEKVGRYAARRVPMEMLNHEGHMDQLTMLNGISLGR